MAVKTESDEALLHDASQSLAELTGLDQQWLAKVLRKRKQNFRKLIRESELDKTAKPERGRLLKCGAKIVGIKFIGLLPVGCERFLCPTRGIGGYNRTSVHHGNVLPSVRGKHAHLRLYLMSTLAHREEGRVQCPVSGLQGGEGKAEEDSHRWCEEDYGERTEAC